MCIATGCDRDADGARGLCRKHYSRWRRHGDPLHTERGKPQAWIIAHVDFDGDDCLKWPFAVSGTGYGAVVWEGSIITASRAMCIAANGPPPDPSCDAAHSCGNGHLACVHPKHLHWATRAENIEEAFQHGTRERTRSPRPHPPRKWSKRVVTIDGVTMGAKEAAAAFGVPYGSIIGRLDRGLSGREVVTKQRTGPKLWMGGEG